MRLKGILDCFANWTGPKSLICLLGIKNTDAQQTGSRDLGL